jgi:hypothetical protein
MSGLVEHASAYQGLIYSIFQAPVERRQVESFMVALVAAHPGAGTSHLTAVLSEALNQDSYGSALTLDCRELSKLCGAPAGLAHEAARRREPPSEIVPCPPEFEGSWRSSREYRATYLARLRERFPYVLIDCPSLKESTDILGLAPLVDGVLMVIEANRTTKEQIVYLERTLERGGGRILGHLLNKRTYPIPEWVHRKLEKLGI